jgi:hypothetical protein
MKKLYLCIVVFFLSLNVFSQEKLWYEKNSSAYKSYFENKYGIVCTIPTAFIDLNKFYVMWKVRNDGAKHQGSMYGPIFLSKDKGCIVAYPTLPFLISKQENEGVGVNRNIHTYAQITGEIETVLGYFYYGGSPLNNDTAKFNLNDYVSVIAGRQPHEMFNADSIYVYDLPNADSVYFFDKSLEKMRKEKYPYCTGVFIYKNGRATMDVKLFFTKEGEKKKYQYFQMLNKQIWYDEKFSND